jgi:DNA polymerases epsilon N terminal
MNMRTQTIFLTFYLQLSFLPLWSSSSFSATMSVEDSCISRRHVTRAFKVRGLTLQASALEGIMSVLAKENAQGSEEILKAILEEVRQRTLSSTQKIINQTLLADVVADMSRNAKDVRDQALQLLDSFETPRLHYDTTRKQFTLMTDGKEKRSLFGEPEDKVRPYRAMCARFVLSRNNHS